jgi:hypothetical protein
MRNSIILEIAGMEVKHVVKPVVSFPTAARRVYSKSVAHCIFCRSRNGSWALGAVSRWSVKDMNVGQL